MDTLANPIYFVSMMIPNRMDGTMKVLPSEAEVHEERRMPIIYVDLN
jgi:hypothetical protein